ncbi:hypothetical protein PIB30_047396 [Stylosanthes scabra]|uniref:Uncharacterized protein n=1 Tax=Stylosanthes scabra TaxID=79078 RepID=A0ABU6QHI0_9FABA|nr:hypothetical protein [Stylosanthes scabra]
MEFSGSLQQLLEDPKEDAGTLDWMELTKPAGHGAEEEGGAANLPSNGNLIADQYARLEHRIEIVIDVLLVGFVTAITLSLIL